MKTNKDFAIMEVYKKDKNLGIDMMLTQYNDYIYYAIHKYFPSFKKDVEDLYQNGVIGLIKAMKTYNPEMGAFTTHCTPFLLKEFSRHVRFIAGESSEYFATIHNNIERAKTKLESNGNEISVENIMNETGLSRKIVNRELKVDRTKVSYEVLNNVKSELILSDEFVINDMLSVIPAKYREIIKMKAIEGMTFAAIGKHFGKASFKIRAEYNEGMDLLRKKLSVAI